MKKKQKPQQFLHHMSFFSESVHKDPQENDISLQSKNGLKNNKIFKDLKF